MLYNYLLVKPYKQIEKEFIAYLKLFYFGPDAVCPMKAPDSRNLETDLITVTRLMTMDSTFEGDTFDREKARDVLIGLGYGIKWDNDSDEYTYRSI